MWQRAHLGRYSQQFLNLSALDQLAVPHAPNIECVDWKRLVGCLDSQQIARLCACGRRIDRHVVAFGNHEIIVCLDV